MLPFIKRPLQNANRLRTFKELQANGLRRSSWYCNDFYYHKVLSLILVWSQAQASKEDRTLCASYATMINKLERVVDLECSTMPPSITYETFVMLRGVPRVGKVRAQTGPSWHASPVFPVRTLAPASVSSPSSLDKGPIGNTRDRTPRSLPCPFFIQPNLDDFSSKLRDCIQFAESLRDMHEGLKAAHGIKRSFPGSDYGEASSKAIKTEPEQSLQRNEEQPKQERRANGAERIAKWMSKLYPPPTPG